MDRNKLIVAFSAFFVAALIASISLHRRVEGNPQIIRYVALNAVDEVRDDVQSHSSDVRAVDIDGHTPLHIAAEHGFPEMVGVLLAAGADPNVADREGFTPLAYSLLGPGKTRTQIIDALVAAGARTDVPVPEGVSIDSVTRPRQGALAERLN